jgi:hypothetical protein
VNENQAIREGTAEIKYMEADCLQRDPYLAYPFRLDAWRCPHCGQVFGVARNAQLQRIETRPDDQDGEKGPVPVITCPYCTAIV